MREDVHAIPAFQIEFCPYRKEIETGLRKFKASLTFQHVFQTGFDGMQVKHVIGAVLQLGIGQLARAPVGGLLGL